MLKAVWYAPHLQREPYSNPTPCWLHSVKTKDGWNDEAVIVLDVGTPELPLKSVKLSEVRVLRRSGINLEED